MLVSLGFVEAGVICSFLKHEKRSPGKCVLMRAVDF